MDAHFTLVPSATKRIIATVKSEVNRLNTQPDRKHAEDQFLLRHF